MSDFDLVAPSMPYEKKKNNGLFGRLFKKEKPAPPAPAPPPAPVVETPPPATETNLEDIKRKLGLTDELPTITPPPATAPITTEHPKELVQIEDWATGEEPTNKTLTASTTNWAATDIPITPHREEPAPLPPPQPTPDTTQDTTPVKPFIPLTPTLTPIEDITFVDAHHDVIDEHLSSIDKKKEKIDDTLRKTIDAEIPDLPDWKLQTKEVPPTSYFILRNGQPIKSLRDLNDAITYIDDTTFDHHVNEYRNDFANWIRDVIGEPELAKDVEAATDKNGMSKVLLAYHKEVAKAVIKEQTKLDNVVKKREETLEKLGSVEDQIATLRKQLQDKSNELFDERKKTAQVLQDKVDAAIKQRLATEKEALTAQRAELKKATDEQKAKTGQVAQQTKALDDRETAIAAREAKNNEQLETIKAAQAQLTQDKQTAQTLLKDAAGLKKQFEDMKKLDAATKKNLESIDKKNQDLDRRETSLKAREDKITSDLTKISAESERVTNLTAAQAAGEALAKKNVADAEKFREEAEKRSAIALQAERESTQRMKTDLKKLESLRTIIDTKLSKALGQKKKITDAIALRKDLERAIAGTKEDVKKEHDEMKAEAFKSMIQEQITTTPVGQPTTKTDEDMTNIGTKQLPIYQKIQACRHALDHRDINTARTLYTELRDDFGKIKADNEERSTLYTNIRELYDDIHLMMLG